MELSPLVVILIVTLISFLIGLIWYSPLCFGPLRLHLSDFHEHNLHQARKTMGLSYLISLLITFIKTYVLAHFVQYLANNDPITALQIGFWIRFGFVLTTQLSETLRSIKPKFGLIALNAAYQLIVMLLSAWLLTMWL